MAVTETAERDAAPIVPVRRGDAVLGSAWVLLGFAVLLLVVMGWRFIADPSLSAPTRDPAWYTWRAQVILDDDPADVVASWGPDDLVSGGYRVTVPLAGALLQRVAGIDRYSFSAFLMLGIPILTGLALGAGAYRSRRDPLVLYTTLLASAAFFLTTPYVGYLDNIMVLFLLSLTLPFLHAARTSWGARTALFLIGAAAAFTHPTTCVVFGVCLAAIFGWHFLTSRFSLGAALKADAPMLLSVAAGMVAGLASWVIGIWGVTASLQEAALPPPYTAEFFSSRLGQWVDSLQPLVLVPLVVIAIASAIALSRRTREPAHTFDQSAIWWMLAFAGIATVVTGAAIPYYRFMNASAAPIALAGLGAFVAIRALASHERPSRTLGLAGLGLAVVAVAWWTLAADVAAWQPIAIGGLGLIAAARAFLAIDGMRALAGGLAAVLVFGVLGGVLWDGLQKRWISESNQWANQAVRTSLGAVHEVVEAAGPRPVVLVMNYGDTDDETGTNTAYGWAKTYTNVLRTGLAGQQVRQQVTYLGTVENFLALERTSGRSEGYETASLKHFCELVGSAEHPECLDPDEEDPEPIEGRLQQYAEPPVAFVIGQYYRGLCNGVDSCSPEIEQQNYEAAIADAVEVGPDVYVLQGPGLWSPTSEIVEQAQAAAELERARFENHPSAFADVGHTLLVIAALLVMLILPGWLASSWFELRTTADRVALIPGMSIVITLLAGIAVLSVWRGPLTTTKGWATVAAASGIGLALRAGDAWLRRPLDAFGRFFNGMFGVFSSRDFAALMGVQFLVMAADGIVRGSIAKSIAFGGQEGFDVTTVPSPKYFLQVVLLLYVPYTFLSPFIGVVIDRFERRRILTGTSIVTAVAVVIVAAAVLLPLGDDTTEGKVGATLALVVGMIVMQACVRVMLAVKSAALPTVVEGKDLLQGNGLSQAGGALFQVVGAGFAFGLGAALPAWLVVIGGAGVLVIAAVVASQIRRMEVAPHTASMAEEAKRVLKDIGAGLRQVTSRAPAALGLSAFQMLRYQFWGFALGVFALYSTSLIKGGDVDVIALGIVGGGGFIGGALGLVLAQKYKDRIPPVRILLASMALLGLGTVVFGALVTLPGFAALLFTGFFTFFLGKISADTIMQQAMPDDFRGRAFALFDIAYNLGFIFPALILYVVWVDDDPGRVRAILIGSGLVFLGLTAVVGAWAKRIRDQFAPQDDLIEIAPTATDPS